jgi:signal transduction histidine kinase
VISVLPSLVWTFAFSGGIGWLISRQQSQTERNAELYDQLQATQAALLAAQHDAGVAAERERLAGEIHDTLAQGFTSIIMQTQVATSALNRGDSDAVSERLGIVDAVARENLAEARGLVAAFAPVALQGASICEALQRLGSRFAAETGIRVIVETDSSCDIPADVEIVILRATQEALNNIRRHSGATAATIRLNHGDNPGIVLLEIADNGIGIPDDVAAGFGLTGMNNRITEIGGSLQIKPTYANPGSSSNPGTTLSITLPLPLN